MKPYTLTVYLTNDQQRQLEAITAAINQQRNGEPRDTAATFSMIMNSGIAYVIDERFKMWSDQFLKEGRHEG